MNVEHVFNYILNHKTVIIPICFVVVFILVGTLAWYFSAKQKVKRILTKLTDKKIISLKSNQFSRITGKTISINEPFLAPLSKRKCVFYQIIIEQETGDEDSSSWKTLIEEERFQEFLLEQNGEYALVELQQYPQNFLCHLVVDKKTTSGSFKKPSPKFEELLRHYNIKSTGFFGFNKQLRYKEAIIEIGEKITVAGRVQHKAIDFKIPDYNYSKIVALQSTEKQKIIITDLPNIASKKRL